MKVESIQTFVYFNYIYDVGASYDVIANNFIVSELETQTCELVFMPGILLNKVECFRYYFFK